MSDTHNNINDLLKAYAAWGENIMKWINYFNRLDSHCSMIIGAERISFHLEQLLQFHYNESGKKDHIIPEELAIRAKNAFKLGLISEPTYQVITQIRKIRNAAAHTFDEITYTNESFDDYFRILYLNIEKIEHWDFLLFLYRKNLYEAARDLKVKIDLSRLEEIFLESTYQDRKEFLSRVLILIITNLDVSRTLPKTDDLSEDLINAAKKDFNSVKEEMFQLIEHLEDNRQQQ